MASISKRLQWLRGQLPQAANQALVDAIGHADSVELAPLAKAILERPDPAGYRVLVRRFHELPGDLRESLRQADGRISPVLGESLFSGVEQERSNALELIASRHDLRCLGAVGRMVGTNNRSLSEHAADIVLNIVRHHMAGGRSYALTQAELDQIDEVLVDTVDRYPEHRQPAVLLAAALMSRQPGPQLSAWLADTDHPSHFAARGVLKRLDEETLAEHLLDWLNIDSLAPQALPHLARLATTQALGSVLQRAHLLCLPRVHRRLQRLDSRRASVVNAEISLKHLAPEHQRVLPLWLRSVPLREADRIANLTVGLSFEDDGARLAALRQLMDLNSAAGDASALSFCFDPCESIARLATRHTVRRRPSGSTATLQRLHLSEHRSVRAMAADWRPHVEFDCLWKIWSRAESPPTPRDRQRAREFAAVFPQRFIEGVRNRFQSESRNHVLGAIRLLRDIDILEPLELDLLGLLGHTDARVVATAVSTLGHIQSLSANDGIRSALSHPNARVRANALDASRLRTGDKDLPDILDFTRADENRIRANAIRTVMCLDRPKAASLLEEMLNDTRPMHRLSALWAADRDRAVECARRVADIAHNDPAAFIRSRARHTARGLLADMRSTRMPATNAGD